MRRLTRFTKKSETSGKPPFLIFNAHTLTPCVGNPDGSIVITALDPGIKNCAFRTSVYYPQSGVSLTVNMVNLDFTSFPSLPSGGGGGRVIGVETQYYSAIFKAFEAHMRFFSASQYICIESQLSINYDMIRMSQHIITYLMVTLRDQGARPLIVEIDSRMKTRMLNAPAKMTKPERKAWAHVAGVAYLRQSGDFEYANWLEAKRKGDDLGDVILYEKCLIMFLTTGGNVLPPPSTVLPPSMISPPPTFQPVQFLQAPPTFQSAATATATVKLSQRLHLT
jgi:hypothetical protein